MLVIIDTVFDEDRAALSKLCSDRGFNVLSFDPPPAKFLKTRDSSQYVHDVVDKLISSDKVTAVIGSHWLERYVNPTFYGRPSLITDEEEETIVEIEQSLDTQKFSVAPSLTAHQVHGRQVSHAEVNTLKKLHGGLPAAEYKRVDIEGMCLIIESIANGGNGKEFAAQPETPKEKREPVEKKAAIVAETISKTAETPSAPTQELSLDARLTTANAIKSVLVKQRIIKGSGPEFDALDAKVRVFLEGELASIFGHGQRSQSFTPQEVEILRALCSTVKRKQGER